MSEYLVQPGDTFASIARIVYGDDQFSGRIQRANPGVNEPLQSGGFIIVPPIESPAVVIPATDDPDQVNLTIDGQIYRFWTEVNFTRSLDSFDSVDFRSPFEPERTDFRDTFRPFSFKPVMVHIGNELAFNGTMLAVNPELQPTSQTVAVGCYSRCAVINDCTAPASGFPLEYRDSQLDAIADQITGMFGFSSEFPDGPGSVNLLSFVAHPHRPFSDFYRSSLINGISSSAILVPETCFSNVQPALDSPLPFSVRAGLRSYLSLWNSALRTIIHTSLD